MNIFEHALLAEKNSDTVDISSVNKVFSAPEIFAWTWFGRPNWAYSKTAQKYWIGCVKDVLSGTTQHVVEYDITNNTYNTYQVGSIYEKDDHNQAQLLLRASDGRLMTFYCEHNGLAVRYRISTNPYDASSWGSELDLNPSSSRYSYPSPYQASNGDIFCFFRDSAVPNISKWRYMKSTDDGSTFTDGGLFYDDGATKAYMVTHQDGDIINFIGTNGHPQTNPELNINVYHFYFDMATETFHKSDGTLLTTTFDYTELTLVASTSGDDTAWILDISSKNGFPRILYVVYPNGHLNNTLTKHLYYIEWDGSSWVNNRFIYETMVGYMEDSTIQEFSYVPASRFDVSNPDIIWMPARVNGKLEIHKVNVYDINNPLIEQITFNSTVDNWRPISVVSSVQNVIWLKKTSYTHYDNYKMGISTKTVLT